MRLSEKERFEKKVRKAAVKATLLLLLMLGLFRQSYCQSIEERPVKTYPARSYYEEDGLASNMVFEMAQAGDGLLWFVTQKGISTFDGIRWNSLKEDPPVPVTFSQLYLLPSQEGGMFFTGTASRRFFLSYHLNGKWKHFPLPADSASFYDGLHFMNISAVEYAPNHFYVAATHKGAFYLFDSATKKWNKYPLPPGLANWQGISQLYFFENQLYILSKKGLSTFNLNSKNFALSPFPELKGRHLLTSTASVDGKELYLLGDNFVGRIRNGVYESLIDKLYKEKPNYISYYNIMADKNNRLFFNHNAALFKLNIGEGKLDPIKINKARSSEIPTKIFEDNEGNIWFCSMRGVSKISSFRFHTLNEESGLIADEISTVFPIDSSTLLLGGNTGYSLLKDNKLTNHSILLNNYNASFSRILDAVQTPDGTTYLAGAALGLGKLLPDDRVQWFPHPENEVINTVTYHKGQLLAGTYDGKMLSFDKGRYTVVWEESNRYIRKIISVKDSSLILLTNAGVYYYKKDSIQRFEGTTAQNENIYSYFPWKGRILLGATGGLCELVNNRIEKITEEGLRIDRPVYALLEDKQGRLWAGTDKGVFVHEKGNLTNFNTGHGLSGKEVNRHAFELMPNGEIWIGTDNGLSVYSPQDDIEQQILPRLRVCAIEVAKSNLNLQKEAAELEYDENTLSFTFQTISFHLPTELNFRSKLEGLDEGWIYSDNHLLNSVRYTNLAPGKYRFVVQARSSDGQWSGAARSQPVTILPPFYTAWWFILLILSLIASIGYAMHAFIMHKRNAKELQKAIEEKKKEIDKSERRFKAIWDATDTGIALINKTGRVLMANPSLCHMLQVQKEVTSGASIYRLLPAPIFSDASLKKMHRDKQVVRKNVPLTLHKKTVYLIVTINFVEHLVPGELLMVVGCKDVTDQKLTEANNIRLNEELLRQNMSLLKKEEELANYNHELLQQAEELEQALQAVEERNYELDQFVYKTSHDLRAPIASAMGLLNIIQLEKDHSRLPEYLGLIGTSLQKQDTFIKAMLSFSKSTRAKNEAEGVDFNELIKQVLQDLQHLPAYKEIGIQVEVTPSTEPFYSDKMKLYIILANIVSNSIKYRNPHIKNQLLIKTEPTEAGALLLVEDNGIGIARENQQAIFDMFYRGTELSDGSGLGLYIVKQTIEKLRGSITVESKLGEGSRFSIVIPNQRQQNKNNGAKSIKIKNLQPQKKNKS